MIMGPLDALHHLPYLPSVVCPLTPSRERGARPKKIFAWDGQIEDFPPKSQKSQKSESQMAEIPKNHFVTATSPISQKLPNFVGAQNPRGTLCVHYGGINAGSLPLLTEIKVEPFFCRTRPAPVFK